MMNLEKFENFAEGTAVVLMSATYALCLFQFFAMTLF